MIEAWNHDLSRPQPGVVYEVPAYESPRFNEGERVHIHSDETKLWRFETLPEPDAQGRARVGHVSGEVNLVARPTRLTDRDTGQVIASLTMANYNVGASDQDYARKMQMLFDAGFLDRDGGYADDADMGAYAGSNERAPDVDGAGTLDESLPTLGQLHTFANSPEFAQVWGPNAWR